MHFSFEHLHILVYVGLLFLISQAGGRIAKALGSPRLIGYLAVGVPGDVYLSKKYTIHVYFPGRQQIRRQNLAARKEVARHRYGSAQVLGESDRSIQRGLA